MIFLSKFIPYYVVKLSSRVMWSFFSVFLWEQRRLTESARIFNPPENLYLSATKRYCHAQSRIVRCSKRYYVSTLLVSVIILAHNIFLRSRSFKHLNLLRICAYCVWIKYRREERRKHVCTMYEWLQNKRTKIDFSC